MNQETLIKQLDQRYASKREMLARIPLGVYPDALWRELLSRRRAKSTVLPLYSRTGQPYWYVITDKMVAASEKIVEALYADDVEFDPYADPAPISPLEEVFYTGYVEGAGITMAQAMEFLTSDLPPRDIEEQLIANNRTALNYAGHNLYRPVNEELLSDLTEILTEGMDNGGGGYRVTDDVDYALEENGAFETVPAVTVPDRMRELSAFLYDPKIHPLIKAAVAQAFIIIVRPFSEGNDRLGRVVSEMILLRAGYVFFREISLSALIARKSYGYYEALANVSREENEGDLTYFIEYFLELLSRAVDERRLRVLKKNDETLLEEKEMARTSLTPPVPSSPAESVSASVHKESALPEKENAEDDGVLPGFFTVSPEKNTPAPAVDEQYDREVSRKRIKDELLRMGESRGVLTQKFSSMLLRFLDEGVETFTSADVREHCATERKQADNLILHLRQRKIIEACGQKEKLTQYRFVPIPPLEEKDYDPAVIDAINALMSGGQSKKDVRLGNVLKACLPGGLVTADDNPEYGNSSKMESDMQLAERLGILEKLRPGLYRIRRQLRSRPPTLTAWQKKLVTDLYRLFGTGTFTREDVTLSLGHAKSTLSTVLHQFTMIGILECRKGRIYIYRLLADPVDNPEFFSDGSQADNDILPDRKENLSEKNPAAVLADLKPHEKKTIATIYEAFGDQDFSTDMFIATVNYSPAYCYASLKNLTMLRILERKNTDEGSRYRMVINPEEYPECFELTA